MMEEKRIFYTKADNKCFACFILKNTPQLTEKLEDLGYLRDENHYYEDEKILFTTSQGYYMSEDDISEIPMTSRFGCGESEDLFLALAAHSRITDYLQWFVIPEVEYNPQYIGGTTLTDVGREVVGESWYLYTERDGKLSLRISQMIQEGESPEFLPHKATIEELVNHFIKKYPH